MERNILTDITNINRKRLLEDFTESSTTEAARKSLNLNYFNRGISRTLTVFAGTPQDSTITYGVRSQRATLYFDSDGSPDSNFDDYPSSSNNNFIRSNILQCDLSNDSIEPLELNSPLLQEGQVVGSPVNLSQADNLLYEKLVGIKQNDSLIYKGPPISFNANLANEKRELIKIKIENTLKKIIPNHSGGHSILLERKHKLNWLECRMENNVLKPKLYLKKNGYKVKLNDVTIELLRRIHLLIETNSMCTQREVYYQLKNSLKRKEQISAAVNCISILLNVEPWYFPINATSKGLIFGSLTIKYSEDHIISINKNSRETLIPQDILQIKDIESNASFIIIVEKDAIFQKLIDEDIATKLTMPFILITGKGYPDIRTRLFTKRLWTSLRIPVFILVDGDPHGIDIMLTYRFGSLNSALWNDDLAIPNLRWIGILPSEIQSLGISDAALSDRDRTKVGLMLKRPYIEENAWLKKELEIMLKNNNKAEIEGVIKNHENLTNFYLIGKLYTNDYF